MITRIEKAWPDWQVERLLGKGSYGVVYQVVRRDAGFVSRAAVKVISIPSDPSEVDSLRAEGMSEKDAWVYLKGIVDSFVDEVRMMEAVKGVQNVVSVEDYKVIERQDTVGWDVLIRMELLTPFGTYVGGRQLGQHEVIRLGVDICRALELCAARNIVHRDIKPENIFINDFGSYKLGDFGVARKLENMTLGLSQKGTYGYMAPEVATGSKYDARVDIYSLGLVLYRLLNHNLLPFVSMDQRLNAMHRKLAVERRIRGERFAPPCLAAPQLAAVIMRACAYDPNARFATATEMKNALLAAGMAISQQAQASRPVQPQTIPRPVQPQAETGTDPMLAKETNGLGQTGTPQFRSPDATVAVRRKDPAVQQAAEESGREEKRKASARYQPVLPISREEPAAPDEVELDQEAPAMCGISIAFCWVPLVGTLLALIARYLCREKHVRGKGLALTGYLMNQIFWIPIVFMYDLPLVASLLLIGGLSAAYFLVSRVIGK